MQALVEPDGAWAKIIVLDNGPGIPADQVEDVFKPFVSTKGSRGTGLGLPVSRKIAEEIFPQKELLKVEVKDTTTELDALNIAMDLERRSHRFFKDFAKQISDAKGKEIFMEFAEDEQSHLQTLMDEYKILVEPRRA